MLCYCKQEIADGARRIALTVALDWGTDDLREGTDPQRQDFCSFKCVEAWAHDRALAHDGIVVKEGVADAA